MSDEQLNRLEQLFRAAQDCPPEERAAFLDAACAGDSALRQELESLLRADEQAEADSFLRDPTAGWVVDFFDKLDDRADDVQGRRIGPYTVLRRLGRGGMGDVYLAVRERPFKRHVALKIIRQELASRETYVRFVMEWTSPESVDN